MAPRGARADLSHTPSHNHGRVPAGGPTNSIARILAQRMSRPLGQSVIIENVSGANGSIAVGRAARAAPDGYTLSLSNWNNAVANGAVYALKYDLVADLTPVALLTSAPLWILSRPTFPASNLADLIAWLKANPGLASAATVGAGSAAHVSGLYFQDRTATSFQFIPYRGGAPAYQDLLAGQVDLMFAEASATRPYVLGGKLRAYAVLAETLWFATPDIPTTDEAGAPGLHISFWHGLWAPSGTPSAVIGRLNGDSRRGVFRYVDAPDAHRSGCRHSGNRAINAASARRFPQG